LRTKLLSIFIAISMILGMVGLSFSQGKIKMRLDVYPPAEMDDNIDPLLDLFGCYTGGGLYHTADIHGAGGFDIGLTAVAMIIPEDLKRGPLAEERIVPLPLLQASLGLPLNLEVMGRFFTYPLGEKEPEFEDITRGNVTLVGVGLKYGLLQTPVLPKIAVMASYHWLIVPEEFQFGDISTISGNLIISYKLPVITLYAGGGVDRTTLKVDIPLGASEYYRRAGFTKEYTRTNFRGTVGLGISLIPFTWFNVDYNFGWLPGIDVGLGISVR